MSKSKRLKPGTPYTKWPKRKLIRHLYYLAGNINFWKRRCEYLEKCWREGGDPTGRFGFEY